MEILCLLQGRESQTLCLNRRRSRVFQKVRMRIERPSLEVTAGVFDSGSWDSFSRFVYATGGRRIVWRCRDELVNVLKNLLTVCGDVLVSFLGDGSRELGRIAIVGSTFQAGVISSLGKLRVVESASLVGADVAQAYIQNLEDQHVSDDDFGDDPTIDDMPHYVPEPEGPSLGLLPVLLQNTTDSDTSDEERFPDNFSSPSASSIEPSEPEHEPSFELSASASSSSGVDGLRAIIERDRPPQEALPSLVLEPLAELSTEPLPRPWFSRPKWGSGKF